MVHRLSFKRLDSEQRFGLIILAIAIVVHLAYVLVNFRQPLLEGFAFRQAQTALTSYWILHEGWQFPPPLPLFGPPWSVPFEFPLYQGIVALVVEVTGWPLDPAGRAISLLFFYLSLPALTLLARRLPLTAGQCLLLPAVALLTPVHLFFARSFGIETLALCAAAWFLLSYDRLGRNTSGFTFTLTTLLAVLAALTKITTYLVFLVPALMVTILRLRSITSSDWRLHLKSFGAQAGSALMGLAVGYAWVQYGDVIKSGNRLAGFLMSANMHDWTYGPISMRFTRAFWEGVLHTTQRDVLSMGNLLLAVIVTLAGPASHRRAALLLALCFLAGPLAFSNLYTVHIYYYFANTIFALGMLVLAWSCLWILSRGERRWATGAVLLSLALQVAGFHRGLFPDQRDKNYQIPVAASWIKTATTPEEVVVIFGEDWSPILPYYAERRVIMISNHDSGNVEAIDQVIAQISPETLGGFLVTSPEVVGSGYENFLARRFGMEEWPALRRENSRFYLPKDRITTLVDQLPLALAPDWTWQDSWASGIPGLELKSVDWAEQPDLKLAEISHPLPSEIRAAFGISAAETQGRPAVNVHAPTVMVFDLPEKFVSAELEFGVAEAAYTDGNETDGVLFRLEFENQSSGQRSVLWERMLTPAILETDRGVQSWRGSFEALGPGRVYLHALAGPANDLSCDWGLWLKINLK